MSFSDGFSTYGGGHETDQPMNTYQVFASISKMTGSHSLKFGAEGRRYQFSQVNWTASTGAYTFDNTWDKAAQHDQRHRDRIRNGRIPDGASLQRQLHV